jgi:hypothetical protein
MTCPLGVIGRRLPEFLTRVAQDPRYYLISTILTVCSNDPALSRAK